MQWLAALCVKRPVFAWVLILSLVVVGAAGYLTLGVDRFPNVDFPIVTVTTRLPGAGPQEVESEVTQKIEEAVGTISGIEELRSISIEGMSQVFVRFSLEKDGDVSAQEVRDRINLAMPTLPPLDDQPQVTRVDPDASPVLWISVTAEKPVYEITEYADVVLKRRLQSVLNVGDVSIVGGRKREIQIRLNPLLMRSLGVSVAEVARVLPSQNIQMPAGSINTGPEQKNIRIEGRVTSLDELKQLVIRDNGTSQIRLNQIAEVVDDAKEAKSVAVFNGEPAVVLAVRKQSGTNTIAVVEGLKEKVDELKTELPAGYSLTVVRDGSEVIKTSADAVTAHLTEGAIFAALVVLIFLGNFRATFVAAIAIPTSIIATFAFMKWFDFTLNTITLLALALAVGIVIDDAIVVLENIFRHIEEKKQNPHDAAINGTRDIGLAVLATTLSLVAVFVPVAFMDGIVGKFLKSFGLTMAFAILVSLFVSFTLTPMLSSRLFKLETEHKKKNLLERGVDRFYLPIERFYMRVLRFCMKRRWVVVLMCVATLGSCMPLMQVVNKGFLPVTDEAQFEVTVRAPEGTSLESTQLIVERIARQVREINGITSTLTTVGTSQIEAPNVGSVFVRLVDPRDRKLGQQEMMAKVRDEIFPKYDGQGLRLNALDVAAFSGGGFSTAKINYVVSGPEMNKLTEYADKLHESLKNIKGAVDVDTSLVVGKPEIVTRIDRSKAAALGVSVVDIASSLRLMVNGEKVSSYEERGQQYDVLARADERFRASEENLGLLTVSSSKLGQVPLLDVVSLKHAEGPSQIDRLNRERNVTLFANPAPGAGESVIMDQLEKAAKDLNLAPGFKAAPIGQAKEMQKAAKGFAFAFALSFIFMYLVLAAQFESWLHPLTILLSLPLTVPFALISLIATGQSLNIFSALGILVLFGVVKKNAILQIDHTIKLREQGLSRLDAILQGNRDRLRPILMTTAAFVAGMIPLAMSKGIGATFNQATAGVVVGGQVLSLLLTLLATPVAYSLFDDVSAGFKRKLNRIMGRFSRVERSGDEPKPTTPSSGREE